MKKMLWGVFLLCLVIAGCNSNKKKETQDKPKPAVAATPVVSFSADSAYAFVKEQLAFGPRIPGSEAHKQCAAYLAEKMTAYCDTVFQQSFIAVTYDGKRWASVNIIGSFAPEKETRMLLGAHWDSRYIADMDPNPANRATPVDGANDGASGVGVLMEIARQLQSKNPEVGVDIIFFDMEDYGTPGGENIQGDWWCLGAQYWAKNKHVRGYKARFGILLDMVGASNATFYHEGISMRYASAYISKVWGMANRLGYGRYFINTPANPITDDHFYVNTIARIPMLNIVHQDKNSNTGFFPHWHTLQDNISVIDRNTLDAVGRTVLSVIYEER